MNDRKQKIMSEIRLRAAQAAGGGYDLDAYELVAADWVIKCQNALRLLDSEGAVVHEHLRTDPDYGLTENKT